MDNYDLQPLPELILMLRSIQMLEDDESTENADLNRRRTGSLLKSISKKIKKDPSITEEAARMNLHFLTLKYIAQILPTADHYVRFLLYSLLPSIHITMQIKRINRQLFDLTKSIVPYCTLLEHFFFNSF